MNWQETSVQLRQEVEEALKKAPKERREAIQREFTGEIDYVLLAAEKLSLPKHTGCGGTRFSKLSFEGNLEKGGLVKGFCSGCFTQFEVPFDPQTGLGELIEIGTRNKTDSV